MPKCIYGGKPLYVKIDIADIPDLDDRHICPVECSRISIVLRVNNLFQDNVVFPPFLEFMHLALGLNRGH